MGQKWRQRRSQKSLRSQNHLPKALVPTKDLLPPQSCSPSTLKKAKNVHAGGISQGRIAPAVPKRSISSVAGPCTSFAIRRNLRGSPKLDAPEFVIINTHSLEKAFPVPQIMTTKTVHGVLLAAFNAHRTRSQDRIRRKEADVPIANKNYCQSQQGDCKHIPACDINAECKFKEKVSRYISYWQCQCASGYKGNGIQCMDGNGTLSVPNNIGVEVTMSIMKEDYTYPYTIGEFGFGSNLENLYLEMGKVAGNICDGEACVSTFNQTDTLN